eukprot:TRINITY_DN417_c1_g1_i1.p1 TRINITY_DN417_c1_g1~~TRINITY_DN417_c1_g1_i1.p1  ORF type:complete len:740 (+),score=151.80 TRINITY_DN417_c1_g1_i1:108-2327(+)
MTTSDPIAEGKIVEKSALDESAGDLEWEAYERWVPRQWNFRIRIGSYDLINVNPIASLASILFIGAFVAWCAADEEAAEDLADTKKWVTDHFTWLYILTQNIWFIFLIVLLFTPYANIKLGREHDKPDFTYGSWFMMLFAAGLGIGLFFFGVAEPVFHYEPCYTDPFAGPGSGCEGNRYAQLPDNERAQWAINLTYYHWGLYGWVVYIVVAVLLGYMTYKEGLPLTMKSTFYPLIGDKIFGWMGDVIDIISVATTMFGVCTSLGLGVKQINNGINRLNDDIPTNTDSQIVIIWVITAVATCSVVSGVKLGIRRLSEITFALGTFLLLAMFFMDDSFYLMNLFTQSIGFYWQKFPGLSFHTDAFEQLYGPAPDWMDGWTVFYWGWWVAWCPFVGMFIAKISKGRYVRDIIIGGMIAPTVYSFFWFATFGGAGLRMERDARLVYNLTADNDIIRFDDGTAITLLSNKASESMWFDLLERYPLHDFFSVVSLIALILYFVTSSDSGSLVIDILTANGHPEPPVLQRIFWALMEGACATALISAGKDGDGLGALQTVSVVAGLPYTVLLCLMCQSLWVAMRKDVGHIAADSVEFTRAFFDPITERTWSLESLARVAIHVVVPWYEGSAAAAKAYGGPRVFHAVMQALCFYAWPVLLVANTEKAGLWVLGWIFLVVYAAALTGVRSTIRSQYMILGDMVTDFLVCITLYPLAIVQMYDEIEAQKDKKQFVTTPAPANKAEVELS